MPGSGLRAIASLMAAGLAALACATASANPVLLFEPDTGRVFYAEEPDRAWHPASVTKLMTAYLTFEAVKNGTLAWDSDVPLSEHARSQPATRIGLRGGIKLNIEQAVRGLVLRSANDFATALAERVGGSEDKFVEAMNATAKRLGMTRSQFRNPHGLPDPEQVTTARDLAILTSALLKDFPDRAEVFSTPTVQIHKGTFHSQNDLLRTVAGADGMKTGFTCASGYNVVASATRDGHRLIAIVLGAVNRDKRSQRATELLETGFSHLASTGVIAAQPKPQPVQFAKASVLSGGAASARHHEPQQPIVIAPTTLAALAVAPADPMEPENIAKSLRTGKCRGYSGFEKHLVEPETSEATPDADAAHAAPVVTGSVTAPAQEAAAQPAVKAVAVPAAPAKAATTKRKTAAASAVAPAAAPRKATAPRKFVRAKQQETAPVEFSHGDGN